jgi:hypothetical protein
MTGAFLRARTQKPGFPLQFLTKTVPGTVFVAGFPLQSLARKKDLP